jgi:hypothetical protein
MFRNDIAATSADVLCGDGTCAVQARSDLPPDHNKTNYSIGISNRDVGDVLSHWDRRHYAGYLPNTRITSTMARHERPMEMKIGASPTALRTVFGRCT